MNAWNGWSARLAVVGLVAVASSCGAMGIGGGQSDIDIEVEFGSTRPRALWVVLGPGVASRQPADIVLNCIGKTPNCYYWRYEFPDAQPKLVKDDPPGCTFVEWEPDAKTELKGEIQGEFFNSQDLAVIVWRGGSDYVGSTLPAPILAELEHASMRVDRDSVSLLKD